MESKMINFSLIGDGISKTFDTAGCIPVVCAISGLMKVIYGVAKVVFNGTMGLINKAEGDQKKFDRESKLGWEHIKNGGLEMFHIKFATIAFVAFTDLLSCCCNSSLEDHLYKSGIIG